MNNSGDRGESSCGEIQSTSKKGDSYFEYYAEAIESINFRKIGNMEYRTKVIENLISETFKWAIKLEQMAKEAIEDNKRLRDEINELNRQKKSGWMNEPH